MALDMIDMPEEKLSGTRVTVMHSLSSLAVGMADGQWYLDSIMQPYTVRAPPLGTVRSVLALFGLFQGTPISPCPCPLSFRRQAPFHVVPYNRKPSANHPLLLAKRSTCCCYSCVWRMKPETSPAFNGAFL